MEQNEKINCISIQCGENTIRTNSPLCCQCSHYSSNNSILQKYCKCCLSTEVDCYIGLVLVYKNFQYDKEFGFKVLGKE